MLWILPAAGIAARVRRMKQPRFALRKEAPAAGEGAEGPEVRGRGVVNSRRYLPWEAAGVGFLLLFASAFLSPLCAQPLRSFDAIFPGLTPGEKRSVFSIEGVKRSFGKNDTPRLIPTPDSGIDLLSIVMEKRPSHLIEALLVIPYSSRKLDMLDAYNAIGRIGNVQDHLYFSRTQNRDIVVFKETTRLESAQKRNSIPDPPHAFALPSSETMYLRFEDANYGTLYLRGDISLGPYGITYNLTNFEAVRFLIFTVMKAEKFSAAAYIEPVEEGMLVYGMAGIDIPGFIAGLINIPSEIEKRLAVLIHWLTDGLRIQDSML